MTPEGAAAPARKPSRDETLVEALVRAHRWRRRIESGRAKSITDVAEQEDVTDAYVCRLLPLCVVRLAHQVQRTLARLASRAGLMRALSCWSATTISASNVARLAPVSTSAPSTCITAYRDRWAGADEPANLITLCAGYHAAMHPNLQATLSRHLIEFRAIRLAGWLGASVATSGGGPNLGLGLRLFGTTRFRRGQLEVIAAALEGKSVPSGQPHRFRRL